MTGTRSMCVAGLLLAAGSFGCAAGGDSLPPPPAVNTFPILLDDRPPVRAAVPPPPVSGGTLLALPDEVSVVVGDPFRDRLLVVNVLTGDIAHELALDAGDEPGRMALDADGRVHVVLRGAGQVLTLLPEDGTVLARREVCQGPRGIAFDVETDRLHVACKGGALVTFLGLGEMPIRTIDVGPDARDVVVRPGGALWVSRFKSATIVVLDADGSLIGERHLPDRRRILRGSETIQTLTPSQAWRMVATPEGEVLVLHQQGLVDPIDIEQAPVNDESAFREPTGSYGGGSVGGCEGITQTAITVLEAAGVTSVTTGFPGSVLAVDVAVKDGVVALANAGARDGDAPMPRSRVEPMPTRGVVTTAIGSTLTASNVLMAGCEAPFEPIFEERPDPTTSVAFVGEHPVRLVSLTLEPATLTVNTFIDAEEPTLRHDLGGDSRRDTGHELFHRDSGVGMACASCHGEGGEDGRTWSFEGLGPRRTQPLDVSLAGTEPFHWDGTLDDVAALMEEVFVGRMGGARQSEPRLAALEDWLFALEPPRPMRALEDAAAQRGRALFESSEVGCAACHSGSALTNSGTFLVGTGPALQVPSLVGVAFRAPLMHDGCAKTLRERFDPACGGGDRHGHTSHLTDAQIDDLIAYMETL